jgi:uncharacterized protein (DUF58 family)
LAILASLATPSLFVLAFSALSALSVLSLASLAALAPALGLNFKPESVACFGERSSISLRLQEFIHVYSLPLHIGMPWIFQGLVAAPK